MCLGFGADSLDDVAAKLEDVLEMQPPQGLVEKVKGLKKLKSIADSMPKSVGRARHHDVVLTGADVDLGVLPVQRCWPLDPAPFVTLPAVITRDPTTGTRNVGMYRMQVIDRSSTFMHWQTHKDGRMDWLAADGKLEVAVALGLDPVTAYSASAPLPKHIDEFQLAGFLRGEPVELVRGKTVDLEVPANAEIVLEGYVVAGETGRRPVRRPHGLLLAGGAVPDLSRDGDDDARGRDLPVDRRGEAAGRGRLAGEGDRADLPPRDPDDRAGDRRLRPARGRRLPQLRHRLDPQVLPRPRPQGDARDLGARNAVALQVRGRGGRSRRRARLRGGLLPRLRQRRPEAGRRPHRGPADQLDHSAPLESYGGKIGIDATEKGPAEGARPWPEEIVMSDEVRALVDRRWDEYAVPGTPSGSAVQNAPGRRSRRLLRR